MTLRMGDIRGDGVRSYLPARRVHVPDYLGSKSTFTLGQFGGHAGRALRTGDVLHLTPFTAADGGPFTSGAAHQACARAELRVIYGPHGAPEYFTPAYMATFFATEWEVHLTPAAPACA
jgi:urea carboxylase